MSEERRLVTILFADVVGSTALGESLDPEDLRALLGAYYAIAREVIEAHGGMVEKFIGDAVMAVFGLPVAHDDDPTRALSAALELRDRVRDDGRLGERLPIRIGVQTGEVVAARNPAADADSLVTGDAVNTAARLQQAAEPWEIVVGERSARASRGFAFEDVTAVEAKGKSSRVAARRLVGRSTQSALRVPLVGREGDLAQLELIAKRAFRERRPFLVSVLAAPGVGKSRLLEEFAERLAGIAENGRIALAQCLPYGQRLTYWPLRGIAHTLLGLPEDATPDALRSAAARWFSDRGDALAERKADVLAATIGGGEVEGIDRSALTDAWRTLVDLAAADSPLVLAIEDLHWSSDSLLDLIESVLQPRGDAPLLMVVLARPELLDRRPTWGGGRRSYVSLSLEPLDDPDVARLVEHLLDGPSPEIVRLVVDRAEGNPFYAGEIVRSIVERVSDLRDGEAVRAAVRSLPDTVQATVLARIDVLPPPVRRAIQLGSVFGRTFRSDGLAAIEPALAQSVEGAVEELIDRDLVRPAGAGVAFRHILIREVAYGTLPRAERARLHAAAADWLAAQAAGREEELAELVAFHYREAATLAAISGDLPPDLRRRAVSWLARAATAASAGGANLEAAGHLRSALELADQTEQAVLYEQLGDTLVGGDGSINAYARALELASAADAPATDRLRLLAAQLMVATRWAGSVGGTTPESIVDLRRRTLDLLPLVADRRVRARALAAVAFAPGMVEGLAEAGIPAEQAAEEALEIARELDDANLQSAALDALSSVGVTSNDMDLAVRLGRQRLELGDRLDTQERGDASQVVAWGLLQLGRLDEALAVVQAMHERFGPGQGVWLRLVARAWETSARRSLGQWDEALAAARRMAELWDEYERSSAGFAVHGFLTALEIARARLDERGVRDFTAMSGELIRLFEPARRQARLIALVDDDPEAVSARIVSYWREFAGRLDQVEIALAFLADRGGHVDEREVTELAETARRFDLLLVEAQAHRALGVARSDPDELRLAVEQFERMGAQGSLGYARADLGLLTGDEVLLELGTARLKALGAVAQLDRLAARRRSNRPVAPSGS